MSLTNKTLAGSYIDLLQLDNSNSGVTTSAKQVKDGAGKKTSMRLSDDQVYIRAVNDDGQALIVRSTATGKFILDVNTSTELVTCSGNTANTQYATFGINATGSTGFQAGVHEAIPFSSQYGFADVSNTPNFGSGTDPATSFTTADSAHNRASDLVSAMWYLPDDITIDSIVSIEGADNATGDTTRMHLFSYDFTSGSTSALTNGVLLAHSSDVTNAGDEQAYLSTWTIDSANVAAEKALFATFESDSVNSDFSIQITVKYHLT